MTHDGVISFARRWAVVGLLGSAVLWSTWLFRNASEAVEADFDARRITFLTDHIAFYTGARLTRFDEDDKLYDYVYVSAYQNRMFAKDPVDPTKDVWTWLEAFRNPPFYALIYWPTCDWPYPQSAVCWFVISFALMALGTWWLTDDGRFGRRLLWIISLFPTYCAFDYGQNSHISFAIFAATFVLLKKDRPFAAGLVAGLLLFKPQLLLGLGVWALFDIRRKWSCALGVLLTGTILASLSYFVLPTATHGFLKSFNSNLEFDSFEQHKMHNPLAFARLLLPAAEFGRWIGGEPPDLGERELPDHPFYKAQRLARSMHNRFSIVMAAGAVGVFWYLWRHRRHDVNVMFGGAVFLTLWANPHTLIYEWMLLGITGLLWVREWRHRPNTWFVLYALAWGVLFMSTDTAGWQQRYRLFDCLPPVVWLIPGASQFPPLYWHVAVQCSVPVLAGVGLYAVALLTRHRPAV